MFRILFSLLFTCLFFNGLNAQTDANTNGRLTVQQLSPADANLHTETAEVEGFARMLAALKTAFAEKDASRTVAYEAYILRAMRDETDQMSVKATAESGDASSLSKIRLEKMTNTLAAFEAHAFDPAKPDAAARDFAQLDEFLKIMQEELKGANDKP
ncbi:MAG: hypothetical protein H7246_09575 [Phycisphaerae bacterium]|nr:hypothetical protein [Saprospiraceae bacterium]